MANTTMTGQQPATGRSRLPAWAAVALIPVVTAALATWQSHRGIEAALVLRSRQILAEKGITGVDVTFDGLAATLHRVPSTKAEAARHAVEGLPGVWSASIGDTTFTDTPASPSPGTGSTAPSMASTRIEVGGTTVTLAGAVPDDATKAAMADAANRGWRARGTIRDQLTVTTGTPFPVGVSQSGAAVTTLIEALTVVPGDRAATWTGTVVALTGSAASEADKAVVARRVLAGLPGVRVDNRLTVASGATQAVDRGALQRRINELVAGSQIAFVPNTAELTPTGAETVTRIADLLRSSDTRIEVNGHVAAVGPATLDGQRLSEERADVVRRRLVPAGVATERITARGFGDSVPLDPANPAVNRRVEIVVV